MKKILAFAIISMTLLSACGNSGKDGKENKNKTDNTEVTNSESTENESFVKELTYKKFVKEIWDFEKFTDSFAYEGKLPCVIDFYATWCGPCKKVTPIMEKLAKEYNGKVIVYKVDVDAEQKLATILNIRNIPTVFFIEKGKQPSYSVGAKDEVYFRARFDKLAK
ncbi:MAG: thioredoxin [Bacteroidales bacterium]|nr:thioredoxin [Bacteroidales bacterium]